MKFAILSNNVIKWYLLQGITVKAVRSDGNTERIIVARILSGGLADTFGEENLFFILIL